ncbi:MAG: hypothetical protein ACO1ON_12825, partial [Nocardioides sp.]
MTAEKFHHPGPSGKDIVLPKFKHVPAGVIRKTRNSNAADQIFTAIEAVADAKTLELIDGLSSEGLNDLVKAWQA